MIKPIIIFWDNFFCRGISIQLYDPVLEGVHEWVVLVDKVEMEAKISFWAAGTSGCIKYKVSSQDIDGAAQTASFYLLSKTPFLALVDKDCWYKDHRDI